jgi:glycosyltransferase involved in cell wall biosynthesis
VAHARRQMRGDAVTVDVVYLARNRLAYTKASFEALLANTDWDLVERLLVYDDSSEDGTAEWLLEAVKDKPQLAQLSAIGVFARHGSGSLEAGTHEPIWGSPVAIMNDYLSRAGADTFAKVDNDVIVPPRWLGEATRVMDANPGLDLLGLAAIKGPPAAGRARRKPAPAKHIGGVGLMRRRAFECCRPVPKGRFGFTEWQIRHELVEKAWISPDLPTFELDRIPVEPWRSLAVEYRRQGWQRPHGWDEYPADASAYWSWWTG